MKNKKVSKPIFINLLMATIIMAYFILINFMYYHQTKKNTLLVLKILSMVVLGVTILLIEIAYRKDNGKVAIHSIEVLVLASHTLSTAYIVKAQNLDFANYILVSSYIFSIYYLLKAIFIYTKERKEYLNSLSDIKEIVENTPTKKEATKKSK